MTTPTTNPTPYLDAARYRTRDDMLGGLRRQLQALPGYAAETAEVSLSDFQDVARWVEHAQTALVVSLVLDQAWTWAMVGAELGVTRAAARNRFGRWVDAARSTRAELADPASLHNAP